jgi:ribonuclease-3
VVELPYRFERGELLELALTHASQDGQRNNERLEFLGDAALALIVTEELFRRHPALSEGSLSELKASLVSRQVLAGAGAELELASSARLGRGMRGGALPRSVLANLYEAVLGAVYLDGGLEAAREFVRATLGPRLARAVEDSGASNPKQMLQEWLQGRGQDLPRYELLDSRGRAHTKVFLVCAAIGGERFPSAWGRTLKQAERWAAFEALWVLRERGLLDRDLSDRLVKQLDVRTREEGPA